MSEIKTAREKMLAGESYLSPDPELMALQNQAVKAMATFNATPQDDFAALAVAARQLFGKVGDSGFIRPPVKVDYGIHIEIGERTFINMDCTFLDCNYIRIGDRVSIGPNCQFLTVTHPLKSSERQVSFPDDPVIPFRAVSTALPITIEDDCWLGASVIVQPGITIGQGAVIGSGSVVTKDVPAGFFAAGNPCRVIKDIED